MSSRSGSTTNLPTVGTVSTVGSMGEESQSRPTMAMNGLVRPEPTARLNTLSDYDSEASIEV